MVGQMVIKMDVDKVECSVRLNESYTQIVQQLKKLLIWKLIEIAYTQILTSQSGFDSGVIIRYYIKYLEYMILIHLFNLICLTYLIPEEINLKCN